ncbi:MAG: Ty1/Copia family ribonuclease HI [Gammaproteobacteria bacterium]|nr:Ty1/Copia family ribonuclease HI [Gammaproteobacteria bacterium]
MSIARTESGIQLSQAAYIHRITEELGESLTPRSTPWQAREEQDTEEEPLGFEGAQNYRRMVVKSMYAANCTRPDISFTVSNLSRHMQEPKAAHWRKLIRLFQYLANSPTLGLMYKKGTGDCEIITYADAALGDDLTRGKGRTGVVVKVGGGPVHWARKTQPVVADSSQAAELLAVHSAAQSTLRISNLLEEVGCESKTIPTILEDNDGTRAIITGEANGKKRCRHLALKYHLVRESCEEGSIRVARVSTREQAADILTKGGHGRAELKQTSEHRRGSRYSWPDRLTQGGVKWGNYTP